MSPNAAIATGLEGRIALVTGASRGIGAAIADQLGQCGARVYGTATSDRGAVDIDSRFQQAGIEGRGLVLDVNDGERAQDLIKQIQEDAGAVEILVNNAGITRDQLLLRLSDEDWSAVLDTNLRSVYRLSKGCLRGMMKARFGRIINIASVIAATGNPGQSNYAAAKAGMIGFSKSLAREVGSRGITVNVVAPGFIDTDMTRELSEQQRESLLRDIPLARLGAVEDIGRAVTFLASEAAGYITGHTLHVNGGMFME